MRKQYTREEKIKYYESKIQKLENEASEGPKNFEQLYAKMEQIEKLVYKIQKQIK